MNDAPEDNLLRDLARRHVEREQEVDDAEKLGDDPRLAAASQPLDAAARQRIVEHLKEVVPDTSNVVPMRSRSSWRFALPLAAGLIAVFSTLVYQIWVDPQQVVTSVSALPAYALRFDGVSQLQRGADPEAPSSDAWQVTAGNRIQVVLTPNQPVAGEITARAFVLQDRDWQPVGPEYLAVSDQGAVRLDAIAGSELALTQEVHQLLLILGAETALPSPEEAAQASASAGVGEGDGWRSFVLAIEMDAAP